MDSLMDSSLFYILKPHERWGFHRLFFSPEPLWTGSGSMQPSAFATPCIDRIDPTGG